MNNSSGSTAILGVIVGVLIVAGVIYFWANGSFNGAKSVTVNVPASNVTVSPPAQPIVVVHSSRSEP